MALEFKLLFSLFKTSLILLFIKVSFFSASSISFDRVMKSKSEEEEEEAFVVLFGELEGEIAKLLQSLLNPTSFESISFSSCLACFLKAAFSFINLKSS